MLRLGLVLLLAGCAGNLPRAGLASAQPPAGGSPAVAWRDVQGRLVVDAPLHRFSCRLVVERDGAGTVRLVALADEGPVLFDVACDHAGVVRHAAQEGMASAAEALAWLAWQAWGPQDARGGRWSDGLWLVADGEAVRTYGGDPLLLRGVDGPGPDLDVGDYRPWQDGLLAFQSVATGTGYALSIKLHDPRPLALVHLSHQRKPAPAP